MLRNIAVLMVLGALWLAWTWLCALFGLGLCALCQDLAVPLGDGVPWMGASVELMECARAGAVIGLGTGLVAILYVHGEVKHKE